MIVGIALWFFTDVLMEKLWILSLLPWTAWSLVGLILFLQTLWTTYRARWHRPSLLRALLIPAVATGLMLVGPGLKKAGSILICCAHPSDATLIENFRMHREEFEQLRTMFLADRKLGRIAPTFTRSASFFSGAPEPEGPQGTENRLMHYRELFRQTGLNAGIEGYDDKQQILFHASTRGLSISGSTKGYAYQISQPEPLVNDLDVYWSSDGRSFTAYRHLDDHWYLYFQFED